MGRIRLETVIPPQQSHNRISQQIIEAGFAIDL
jgi:hypothetical protein